MRAEYPITVFCKHIVQLLENAGAPMRPGLCAGIKNMPPNKGFVPYIQDELMKDVHAFLVKAMDHDPSTAVTLLVNITGTLQPAVIKTYQMLMDKLEASGHLYSLWSLARNDEALYAFATYFVLLGLQCKNSDAMSGVISELIGKPFGLGAKRAAWNDEVTLALFGPAWHLLCMKSPMRDADYIAAIMHLRPGFVGRTEKTRLPLDLPDM